MKHLIVTAVVFILVLSALVFGIPQFFPEYASHFTLDFIYGYIIAGGIAFLGFYCLTTETDYLKTRAIEAQKREEQIAELQNKLEHANQLIKQLQEKSDTITLSATQAADYIYRQTDQANIAEIQRLKIRINNAIVEYKKLEAASKEKDNSIEKLAAEVKSKNSGLASYRQKMALIKHLANQFHLPDGSSFLDVLANEWKQLKTEPGTREEKAFVPSAPTKGKRAQKYK